MWLYGGNDIYTKLLIHGEEVVTSNEFIESSLGGKTVTVINAVQSTEQYKFGTKSWYFDGTGDYLSLADSADWDFGTGNWTIDFWVRLAATQTKVIYSQVGVADAGNNQIKVYLDSTDGVYFTCLVGGLAQLSTLQSAGKAITTNAWTHIAIVRNGTNWQIYKGGTSIKSITETATMPDFDSVFYIGCYNGASDYLNGWIDGFRISKGVARWTSDFTPPALPYGLNTPRIISVS